MSLFRAARFTGKALAWIIVNGKVVLLVAACAVAGYVLTPTRPGDDPYLGSPVEFVLGPPRLVVDEAALKRALKKTPATERRCVCVPLDPSDGPCSVSVNGGIATTTGHGASSVFCP